MSRIIAVAAALLVTLNADVRAQDGFRVGYTDLGAVLGLGNIGDAGVSIGARFERAIKALPDMGNGVLAIQASIDWWSYSYGSYTWSWFPVSATGNYHFQVEGGKIDPFLGLGLGMWISSIDCGPVPCPSTNSGVYFVGRAGIRYFFSPVLALYADAGAGAATINAGLTFKLSGGN